jgi:peptidoglycan hydrolase-like protein with peptidoglycan-binding domain
MKKTFIALLISALLLPAVSFAATFNQNLSYGSSGSAVTDLQNFLTAQGLYTGPITGGFFNLTKRAVIAFQQQNGIQPASGFFGPLTRAFFNKIGLSTSSVATANLSTPTISNTNSAPPVQATTTPWAVLEVRGFAEANQNGWTELTIPNEVGEQHYYRLENGTWVQKDTLAEAQQPYQPPLPPPTATELAGITWMCDQMTVVATSVSMQDCNSNMLTVYDSNAAARANMDFLIQTLQQEQSNSLQTQAQNTNNSYLRFQLQQLQNSVAANSATIQQEQQQAQQQAYQQQQAQIMQQFEQQQAQEKAAQQAQELQF